MTKPSVASVSINMRPRSATAKSPPNFCWGWGERVRVFSCRGSRETSIGSNRQEMNRIVDSPIVVGAVSAVALWLAAKIGDFAHNRIRPLGDDERGDFSVVLTSTLTLLALIIGFTFSMAVSRYDRARITKSQRPMRSARSTSARISCLVRMLRRFANCLGNMSISVSCSTQSAMRPGWRRSTATQRRCRMRFGLPSGLRPAPNRRRCRPLLFPA